MHWPQYFHLIKLSDCNSSKNKKSAKLRNKQKNKQYEQKIRIEQLSNAIKCADNDLPYIYACITKNALWHQWGIDYIKRASEYRGKLPPNNTQTINFKVVELKFAFTLALFISDTLEEACEAMYAFGHIQEIIPPRFRAGRLDYHVDACYRVILQVYSKYTTDSIVDEKMRVDRLLYALDYIQDKKNAEKNLCDYFFGSEK